MALNQNLELLLLMEDSISRSRKSLMNTSFTTNKTSYSTRGNLTPSLACTSLACTKDRMSNFRLNVEIHWDSGEVLLSLVLRPNPGSSPPSPLYEFQVSLVGEKGEDKGGCAMSVLCPQEKEGPIVEKKKLVGNAALDFLRQRCSDREEIVFRVEELQANK